MTLLGKPQVGLRSRHIPTVSAGNTLQLQPPTICSLTFCTRENTKLAEPTRGVPLAAVQGAGSCVISSSSHSAHKLETGQAALLGIDGQGHVTPTHAADVNAFLIIASFILQAQPILDMCFLEAQRISKSLAGPETGKKSPETL
jgi:hypothetical protein